MPDERRAADIDDRRAIAHGHPAEEIPHALAAKIDAKGSRNIANVPGRARHPRLETCDGGSNRHPYSRLRRPDPIAAVTELRAPRAAASFRSSMLRIITNHVGSRMARRSEPSQMPQTFPSGFW
jgi:hypothetical protein